MRLSRRCVNDARRLPVTDDGGQLRGILSINDVVLRAEKLNGKRARVSYEDVIETFKAICAHQQPVRAEQQRAAP
jgi:CBS domain-containing protein